MKLTLLGSFSNFASNIKLINQLLFSPKSSESHPEIIRPLPPPKRDDRVFKNLEKGGGLRKSFKNRRRGVTKKVRILKGSGFTFQSAFFSYETSIFAKTTMIKIIINFILGIHF